MTRAVATVRTRAGMIPWLGPIAAVLFLSVTACIGDAPMVRVKNDGGAAGGRSGTGGTGGGPAGAGGSASGGQSGAVGGGGSSDPGSGGAGSGGSATGGRGGNVASSGGSSTGGGGGVTMSGSGGQAGAGTDGGLPVDGAGMEAPAPAKLSVDREQVAFGAVTVGASSTASVLVVKNIGGAATGALTIGLTGAGATLFAAITNACAGMVLVPGASCSLSVTFAPRTSGTATATLAINGGATVTAASTLNGTGEFASIVANLDGALLTIPCNGATLTGYSCVNVGCGATGGVATAKAFPLGGTANTTYDLTFRVRGIVEGYLYQGGTRDQGTASPTTNPDLFHRGGQLQAEGPGAATFNSYQLDVSPAISGTPTTYFLNSIPITPIDPSIEHVTFPIDYTKTIRVRGGGSITFRTADNDCRMIMNCGPTPGTTMCAAPRTVSLDGASPAPAASFVQPFRNADSATGQWLFVDVTSVAVAP